MKKSKIISVLQTDNSSYTNSLIRGLLAINSYVGKKNIAIDTRQNSNVIWTYYGKKNIKYLDDILNVVLNVNISMIKSYFDGNRGNRDATAKKKHKTKQDLFTRPVLSYGGIYRLIYHKHTIIYAIT